MVLILKGVSGRLLVYYVAYLPMQFQTAVEYQRFADRWFKCCGRVALDSVSALNLWWDSGSSFGFGLNDAIPVLFRAFFMLLMYPKSLFC